MKSVYTIPSFGGVPGRRGGFPNNGISSVKCSNYNAAMRMCAVMAWV